MRTATTKPQRTPEVDVQTSHQRALIVATLLVTLMRFGAFWDAQWHWAVGRDSFFIPPHLLIYSATALIGLLSLTMAWRSSMRRGSMLPIFWSWITQLFGVVLLVSAAPFDDLWHQRYGIDVTIWSPPHLLGVLGACIVGLGIFTGWALEWQQGVDPRRTRTGIRGLVWTTAILVSMFNFALIPATRWSVLQPAAPVLYMVLGPLLIPGIFLALGWITGRMWPILLVLIVLVLLRLVDQQVWNYGMQSVVSAWGQTVRSTDTTWFDWHFWLHIIFNSIVALTVFAFAGSWRIRRRVPGAVVTGLVAGFMLYSATAALSSGMIFRTLAFVDEGQTGRDFHTESNLLVGLIRDSQIAPWGWALICGAASGVGGYSLVRLIRRAGRPQLNGTTHTAPRSQSSPSGRPTPVRRSTNVHVD